MRVLFIANTLPPRDVSGVGEQVLQLAAGLRELGHEVEVLGRGTAPGDIRGPKLLFPLCAVPATRRALARLRPHVVQVHESDGALAALLVAALRRRLDPPPLLVALLQVSYVEERRAVRPLTAGGRELGRPGAVERRFRLFKAPLQIALGRLTARLADQVLAPSRATAEEVRRDYGVPAVAVVPNVTGGLAVGAETAGEAAGVARKAPGGASESADLPGSPETGDPAGTPAREAAEAESAAKAPEMPPVGPAGEIAEPPGYLLFVGRLRIRKGVEVLLAALASARASHPGVRLLVAGDGEHRGPLERRAAELGLGGTVAFLGRCNAPRVRLLLAGARALVVPSIYEGMPLVVLEAMEQGVPVVASGVSGIPEVVADGATGWLVPPEDPGALAAALGAVLADPAEAARRGAAGRLRLDERFRPEAAARAWEREIGRTAERRGMLMDGMSLGMGLDTGGPAGEGPGDTGGEVRR